MCDLIGEAWTGLSPIEDEAFVAQVFESQDVAGGQGIAGADREDQGLLQHQLIGQFRIIGQGTDKADGEAPLSQSLLLLALGIQAQFHCDAWMPVPEGADDRGHHAEHRRAGDADGEMPCVAAGCAPCRLDRVA
jgi:hypothetical protein